MSTSYIQDCSTQEASRESKPLNSQNRTKAKRTLIIPDVHHRWKKAQAIIDQEKPDHVIHLGDHQDNFGDNPWMALATAKWTKSRLDAGDTILLGNHDLPYWYPHEKHVWGCGWDSEKHKIIQGVIDQESRKKFKLWTICEGWLLSHAGFTSVFVDLIPHHDIFIDETLHSGSTHPLIYGVGALRGGRGRGGGVLWCDWKDLCSEPGKPKLKQLVGHTPHAEPQLWDDYYFEDCPNLWNLDTHLNHYGIIEDGKLTIIERLLDFAVAPV